MLLLQFTTKQNIAMTKILKQAEQKENMTDYVIEINRKKHYVTKEVYSLIEALKKERDFYKDKFING